MKWEEPLQLLNFRKFGRGQILSNATAAVRALDVSAKTDANSWH